MALEVTIAPTGSRMAPAAEQVQVNFTGTYPRDLHPGPVDVVNQARSEALAQLGEGDWRLSFDLGVDTKNHQWVVEVHAQAFLDRAGIE